MTRRREDVRIAGVDAIDVQRGLSSSPDSCSGQEPEEEQLVSGCEQESEEPSD